MIESMYNNKFLNLSLSSLSLYTPLRKGCQEIQGISIIYLEEERMDAFQDQAYHIQEVGA